MTSARLWAAGVSVALALPALPALAQELDLDRFEPAVTTDGFIVTEGSGVRPTSDRWAVGLFIDYAHHPLVIADQDNNLVSTIVATRLSFEAQASVTIAGPFALGLGVPFFIAQTGDANPDFAGLEDIRIMPKLRLLDDRKAVGLGLIAEIRPPNHVGDFSASPRMVVVWPRLTLDHWFAPSGFRIGTNLGVKARKGLTLANIEGDSEFTYSLALAYRFGGPDGRVELGVEGVGAVAFADDIGTEEVPLEIDAYIKGRPDPDWELDLGPGFGVVPGYGEPIFRVFTGFRWTPTSHDRDYDGIPDDEDKCPDQAENRNGIEDTDGCPDEEGDDDHDGVLNSEDDCPNEKETINGVQDEDGCADGGPAKVIRESGEIVILENIQFESGSATIKKDSYSILNQVALVMRANPDIKHLRVEGHTDERGDHELNMQLSKARADSVRTYLMGRGVRGDRLEAKGYGPDKPIASGDDPASLAKNRRVEFKIDD